MKTLATECKGTDGSCLLRLVLKANAWFSLVSAMLLLVAAKSLAAAMGAVRATDLTLVGAGLVAYSGVLFATAKRQRINGSNAWPFIILDIAWVLGSGLLVVTAPLTTVGKWTVIVVADLVLMFAIAQFIGVRRLQQSGVEVNGTEIRQTRRDSMG